MCTILCIFAAPHHLAAVADARMCMRGAVQLQAAQAERDTQGVQLRKLRSKRAEQAKALDRVGAELAQALEQRRQLQEDAAQAQASLVQRDVQLRDLQQALAAAQLSGEAAGALEARVSELQVTAGPHQGACCCAHPAMATIVSSCRCYNDATMYALL